MIHNGVPITRIKHALCGSVLVNPKVTLPGSYGTLTIDNGGNYSYDCYELWSFDEDQTSRFSDVFSYELYGKWEQLEFRVFPISES